jgi:hypothetical protein
MALVVAAALSAVPNHFYGLLTLFILRAYPSHPRKSGHAYCNTFFSGMARRGINTALFKVGVVGCGLESIRVDTCGKVGGKEAAVSDETCVPSKDRGIIHVTTGQMLFDNVNNKRKSVEASSVGNIEELLGSEVRG